MGCGLREQRGAATRRQHGESRAPPATQRFCCSGRFNWPGGKQVLSGARPGGVPTHADAERRRAPQLPGHGPPGRTPRVSWFGAACGTAVAERRVAARRELDSAARDRLPRGPGAAAEEGRRGSHKLFHGRRRKRCIPCRGATRCASTTGARGAPARRRPEGQPRALRRVVERAEVARRGRGAVRRTGPTRSGCGWCWNPRCRVALPVPPARRSADCAHEGPPDRVGAEAACCCGADRPLSGGRIVGGIIAGRLTPSLSPVSRPSSPSWQPSSSAFRAFFAAFLSAFRAVLRGLFAAFPGLLRRLLLRLGRLLQASPPSGRRGDFLRGFGASLAGPAFFTGFGAVLGRGSLLHRLGAFLAGQPFSPASPPPWLGQPSSPASPPSWPFWRPSPSVYGWRWLGGRSGLRLAAGGVSG